MTKKDYEMLAGLIFNYRQENAKLLLMAGDEWLIHAVDRELVVPLANKLKEDNPNFEYGKFLRACGLEIA